MVPQNINASFAVYGVTYVVKVYENVTEQHLFYVGKVLRQVDLKTGCLCVPHSNEFNKAIMTLKLAQTSVQDFLMII